MNRWTEEPIVFDCGGNRLVGVLHRGADPGASLGVLVVVGGPQYRVGSHRQFVLMARDLAAAGYPVLRFDYRGMGDSEGEPRQFESIDDDLRAAIAAFQRASPCLRGLVLWGLCDAASAIMMSSTLESVRGKVLVNPWVRTVASEARVYVRHYYLQRVLQKNFWRKLGSGALDIKLAVRQLVAAFKRAATPLAAGRGAEASYIDRMLAGSRDFGGPTLVLLSGRDLTAHEFEALCSGVPDWRHALSHPAVHFVRIENGNHTFSDRSTLDTATRATIEWLNAVKIVHC